MGVEPHLTFLHGQPGSGSDWDSVIARLPPGFATLAADRPGYGHNPTPAGDFDHNARDVLAALDAAGVPSTVVVAHSFGGGVGLALARTAPERVRGLVLVSSIGPGCLNGWDTLLAAPVAGPVCAVCAWWLTPWTARLGLAVLARRRGRPAAHHEHVNWDVWGQARHHHGAMWRTFLVEQRALVTQLDAVVTAAATITCPALLLADPGDTMIPVATSHALSALLPNSRVQLVPGPGHHLPRRAADVVAEAVTSFCARLEPQPTT